MKKETKKMSLKDRIIFAVTSGVLFALMLYLFDILSAEQTQTVKALIFQGVFFGVFFGLGYPYLNDKFRKKEKS